MKTFRITGARQKALLASSVRQDLLDTVGAAGPSTARELAQQLGMRASAVYYHLQLLERGGLLTRRGSKRGDGRDEAVYAARAGNLIVDHDTSSKRGRAASRRIARALLGAAERDLAAGARFPGVRTRAPGRNFWVSRVKGWLTAGELRAVLAHLQAIDALVLGARRGPRRTLCAVSAVLAPLASDAGTRRSRR